MLEHYLQMALRGFVRHKLYSFINVVGLSVALACAILTLLFVRDQLSYDAWIPGTQNLYRLALTFHVPGDPPWPLTQAPFPVITAMGEKIPQVKAAVHVVPEKMTVMAGARQGQETVTVVDPSFLQVLRLLLLEGDPTHALAQPESVVISARMARKYFGDADPMNRTLRVSGKLIDLCAPHDASCYGAIHPLTVTGVLRDLPHDTQLVADFLVPNGSQADELTQGEKEGMWTGTLGGYGYVGLAPGASPVAVLAALRPILDNAINLKQYGMPVSGSQMEQYHLIPFRDVHLDSDKYGGMTPAGSRATVYGFAVIALLIVLVACSNFMNLATARATLRAREIAVRKVAGARRNQIALQILSEAALTGLIAFTIALSIAEIVLPAYDRFLGEPIRLRYFSDWRLICAMAGGALLVGLLSGIYPALVLSGFRPASALKSGRGESSGSGLLRSALVVGQFAVSIAVGIAVMVIFRQINYARGVDLGFNRDHVVVIRNLTNLSPEARQHLARILRSGPGIEATALSDAVPFDLFFAGNMHVRSDQDPRGVNMRFMHTGPSFAPLYRIRLLAGRLPSPRETANSPAPATDLDVLISGMAAHQLGYSPDEAAGKMLTTGDTAPAGRGHLRVVGVLDDALFEGAGAAAKPMLFLPDRGEAEFLSARVRGADLPQALRFMDGAWRSLAPAVAMDRYFLTDAFNEQFAADEREGTVFAFFVGIAILIGCLGLFGLAVFTAEQRTKEIGIRKVSGARSGDIVRLMLWRISVPVLAANVVAWPLAYYYLRRWLDHYAYRIPLEPAYFLAAGAVALFIAWATVYANTLRLARTNPVRSLRYE
ncbi:MAG TPA: FtsX-like permease family protein [Steroidobacteraceae bacterium]|jgi:putative ABC transport system permease protein|nr:FtsX-like permease family protein [Steroidobacteraceae bacterium]